jgi:hypothetical protein
MSAASARNIARAIDRVAADARVADDEDLVNGFLLGPKRASIARGQMEVVKMLRFAASGPGGIRA